MEDDDGIFGLPEPGKRLSNPEHAVERTAKALIRAYEAEAARVTGRLYSVGKAMTNNSVWRTMAKMVMMEDADPVDWVQAHVAVRKCGDKKMPYPSALASKNSAETYRMHMGVSEAKGMSDANGSLTRGETRLQYRIQAFKAYMADNAGTSDPDSLAGMAFVTSRPWGVDPLAILLCSTQKVYMKMFSDSAMRILQSDVQLDKAVRDSAEYSNNYTAIIKFVQNNRV